jgi:phosphatidylglycerophosphatase A
MSDVPTALPDAAAVTRPAAIPRPSLSFLLAHPAHGLALGCGAGLLRPAPGTWGTLFGWAVYAAFAPLTGAAGWALITLATFFVGALAAHKTGEDLGRQDHGAIVIDEIVAIWVVLLMLPATFTAQALGVLAFRVFDIAKPPPVGAMDRRLKSGFGAMLDDLVAAFYALLAAAVVVRLVG